MLSFVLYLSNELNPSIRTKYLWLKRKINAAIDNTTELKNHFLELDNKKREGTRSSFRYSKAQPSRKA